MRHSYEHPTSVLLLRIAPIVVAIALAARWDVQACADEPDAAWDQRGGASQDTALAAPCDACRLQVRTDYLYWWTRGAYLPPLATTSPAGTVMTDAGVLGEPYTEVLVGNQLTSSGPRSGVRGTASIALDEGAQWWLATDWLWLGRQIDHFGTTSAQTPILARPFYDVALGANNSELVCYPAFLAGGMSVDAANDFWAPPRCCRRTLPAANGPRTALDIKSIFWPATAFYDSRTACRSMNR